MERNQRTGPIPGPRLLHLIFGAEASIYNSTLGRASETDNPLALAEHPNEKSVIQYHWSYPQDQDNATVWRWAADVINRYIALKYKVHRPEIGHWRRTFPIEGISKEFRQPVKLWAEQGGRDHITITFGNPRRGVRLDVWNSVHMADHLETLRHFDEITDTQSGTSRRRPWPANKARPRGRLTRATRWDAPRRK